MECRSIAGGLDWTQLPTWSDTQQQQQYMHLSYHQQNLSIKDVRLGLSSASTTRGIFFVSLRFTCRIKRGRMVDERLFSMTQASRFAALSRATLCSSTSRDQHLLDTMGDAHYFLMGVGGKNDLSLIIHISVFLRFVEQPQQVRILWHVFFLLVSFVSCLISELLCFLFV